MNSRFKLATLTATLTIASSLGLASTSTALTSSAQVPSVSIASFEGRTIDLRKGWGQATACVSDGQSTTCFRTEKQLQVWLGEPSTEARAALSTGSSGQLRSTACATTLRLYDGTGYTSPTLYLTARNTVFNLAGAGFAGVTSSYQVGACSSVFKDQDNLLGSTYPGSTGAGVGATAMVPGWNNRVRSVYIY
jgi:hypothetical protein